MFHQKNSSNNSSQERTSMSFKGKLTLIGIALLTVLLAIGTAATVDWERVEGSERLITQNWADGVSDVVVGSGTFFFMPVKTTVYKYNVGAEKFIMGSKEFYNGKGSDYIDYPAYTITTGGDGNEQPATFSVTLQYHLDSTKLVALHNEAGFNYEDLIIKPALTKIISDQATTLKVLDFYSGQGRVNLQNSIRDAITVHPRLSQFGIVVDTLVFDAIILDNDYVSKIRERQLAYQDKLKNIEQAKAAQENAKRVEAVAEAARLKLIVEADALKQQQIKQAEAANESAVLAAKADAAKKRLEASAERYRKEQDAKGALALGLAEAQVADAKKVSKYSGVAGERAAAVEIEQARVGLFTNMNLKGIVPADTVLTIINGTSTPALTLPATTTRK
jgi:regulator of protease activity HflC (stomatin/prohibitin superfamily)